MARGRIHRPLAVARWVFLALLVLTAAWVARLYLERQRPPEEPPRAGEQPVADGEADLVITGEGFEYEVTEDGRTLFSIEAARMSSDRENRYGLEQVRLSMDRDGEDHYEVVSQAATYELDSRNARLRGAVELSGPDGLRLRGEGYDLRNRGRVLVSTTTPSEFELPGGFAGTATAVRLNLHRRHVILAGAVSVLSRPGVEPAVSLRAARVAFNRGEGRLRAEGAVELRRGGDVVRCRRLSAELEEGGGVRFVHCNWQVRGSLEQGSSSARRSLAEFSSRKLAVEYGPGGREARRVELEGSVAAPAVLVLDDGSGLRRTVRSSVLVAELSAGAVERVDTLAAATLEESLARPDGRPLRRLCGDSLSARFTAGGDLERLVLDGSVSYQEDGLSARGARLAVAGEERLELTGSPAHTISASGEVEAPRIVYSRRDGAVRAEGGVVAAAQERAGIDLAVAGNARRPVRVQAKEATWTEQPEQVSFEGQVRAWQGENFLLADRLETTAGGRLVAEGSVKTVWKPPADAEARAPVEVNAGRLEYLRGASELHYSETVRAHESGRTMRCKEMDLLLAADNRIDRLVCRGDAVVEDPRLGRVIRGAEAVYEPTARFAVFSGEPVVMRDRDGTEIQGRRLRYDLDSGQTRILSDPREPEGGEPGRDQPPAGEPPAPPPTTNHARTVDPSSDGGG